MDAIYDTLMEWAALYGLKVVAALVILAIGRLVVGVITGIVRRLLTRSNVDVTLTRFVANLTEFALLTVVAIMALDAIGIQTSSFVAILGAADLTVGLALQGSLANFAAGVPLIIFRPFRAGDFVVAAGTMGSVQEIQIFTTVPLTPDNEKIIVPSSQVTGGTITNSSAMDTRRVDLVFGIGYGDDIRKAKDTLGKIAAEDARIPKDPAPTIAVSELADSSVDFVVRPRVKSSDCWAVYCDLHEKVKSAFDAQAISIPFPQRDVHLFRATG